MRLGIISDLHANIVALDAVLEVFRRDKVDKIVCLGDLVGYGPFPNETVERVKTSGMICTLGAADERVAYSFAHGQPFGKGVSDLTLAWTCDVIGADERDFLRTLPLQQRLETPAGRLRAFHGTPTDPGGRLDLSLSAPELAQLLHENRASLIACGGSHIPYAREVKGGWFINPGSVGLSLNGEPGADYALVDIAEGGEGVKVTLGKARYDFAAVAFDVIAWGLPDVVAETLKHGRLPVKR